MAASFLTGTDSSFWANDFRDSILKAEGDATLFDYADLHRSQTSLIYTLLLVGLAVALNLWAWWKPKS